MQEVDTCKGKIAGVEYGEAKNARLIRLQLALHQLILLYHLHRIDYVPSHLIRQPLSEGNDLDHHDGAIKEWLYFMLGDGIVAESEEFDHTFHIFNWLYYRHAD